MDEIIESRIARIESLESLHICASREMLSADSGKIYPVDLLASAAIKRSLSLCSGFSTMVRSDNYLCAASLLRLQLDSCLRLFSAFLVDRPHEMASMVLKGVAIRKQKDSAGKLMTDQYLVERLSEKYPWVSSVYQNASGFIHLSEKHILSMIESCDENGSFSMRIGTLDQSIPPFLWQELVEAFLAITDILFEYVSGWVLTKNNPQLVAQSSADTVLKNNR